MQTILHIGQAKTGTTALQTFLHENQAALLERGIFYPRLPFSRNNHHALLPAIFRSEHLAPFTIEQMGFSAEAARKNSLALWDALEVEVAERRPERLILSSEALFRAIDIEEADRLTRRLGDLSREADRRTASTTVVAFLRSPPSLFLALFQQKMRTRSIRQPLASPSPLRQIMAYERSFGTESLALRAFERAALPDGDVVSGFFEAAGLGPRPEGLNSGAELNPSMSAEAMTLLQELGPAERAQSRRESLVQKRMRRRILRIDGTLPGFRKPALHPWISDALVAGAIDYPELRDRYSVTFSDIDYGQIGRPVPETLREVWKVEDICAMDSDRLAEMRAQLAPTLLTRARRLVDAVTSRD